MNPRRGIATVPAFSLCLSASVVIFFAADAHAQVAIRGKTIHTMAGGAIKDAVVVIKDGKIAAVGPAATTKIPDGFKTLDAAVVTPGLIDAHCVVGLSGIYNQPHDQDQLEHSSPMQPELRAIDAYNCKEQLVSWVRAFGVTTLHTGHAPGELISGQTCIVKTRGNTVEEALVVEAAAVACTLSPAAQRDSPGTRGKMMSMLRAELIRASEFSKKQQATTQPESRPDRNLRHEALARVLAGELPLMITANRAQDIDNALRLAAEFKFRLILDCGGESYLMLDAIKAAGVPVILHPSMYRAVGDMENMSVETAAKLRKAGIRVAMQSGYEGYVPKTRVVLWEAAITAANGLTFDEALATITIDAARILGVEKRLGSLEPGKDGDLALYDGDPFEYTTHCLGVVIDGQVMMNEKPK